MDFCSLSKQQFWIKFYGHSAWAVVAIELMITKSVEPFQKSRRKPNWALTNQNKEISRYESSLVIGCLQVFIKCAQDHLWGGKKYGLMFLNGDGWLHVFELLVTARCHLLALCIFAGWGICWCGFYVILKWGGGLELFVVDANASTLWQ